MALFDGSFTGPVNLLDGSYELLGSDLFRGSLVLCADLLRDPADSLDLEICVVEISY